MCGIFGVIRTTGIVEVDGQVFNLLSDSLRHRGPDGEGDIRTDQVLLGMHRLSIMDIDSGWQPFWSEDNTIGVLGNGEIYNAAELRQGLLDRGHHLRSHSDIEVVAHLYEEAGIDCITLLRGMFALVVLDQRRSEVVLIRDRLGEKPLSYVQRNGRLCFASEQTALVSAGATALDINDQMLTQYLLHGFVPEPSSIIQGVYKVPAAHALRLSLKDGSKTLHRYWDPMSFVGDRTVSPDQLSREIEEAVSATSVSDVPVAVALSGGLDSSMIAAIASQSRSDIQAFTVGYSENGFDESRDAHAYANELGIPCDVITLETGQVAQEFAAICGMRDEPISDIAGPAIAALPRAAHDRGFKVLLTGVGGDELFWGYEWIRHLAAWSTNYLSTSRDSWIRSIGLTRPPSTKQGLVAWSQSMFGLRTERDLRHFMTRWSSAEEVPLPFYEFQYGYKRIIGTIKRLVATEAQFPKPEFWGTPRPDSKGAEYIVASNDSYLRVNSLTQVDRLSMNYAVESRTPFADHQVLELVLSGSADLKQVFEPTKSRQRQVAAKILPANVLARQKRGFTPPVRNWARAIWAFNWEALSAEAISNQTSMDANVARSVLGSPTDRFGRVNQMALRLMTLELWLRSFR